MGRAGTADTVGRIERALAGSPWSQLLIAGTLGEAYDHGVISRFKDPLLPVRLGFCEAKQGREAGLHLSWLTLLVVGFGLGVLPAKGQSGSPAITTVSNRAVVLSVEGTVETSSVASPEWKPARRNQVVEEGERVRTGERGRATLQLADKSSLRVGRGSEIRLKAASKEDGGFSLMRGLFYFFHRGPARRNPIETPTVRAGTLGTEFHVEVAANGRTVITMFDGEVELSNGLGTLRIRSGEKATVDPGQAPMRTAMVEAINVIQWCLYYPGVLDLDELTWTPAEADGLESSVAAYRAGDLLGALDAYPVGQSPSSDGGRVYLGAVLLAVGRVEASLRLLEATTPSEPPSPSQVTAARLASALRRMVGVIRGEAAVAGLAGAPESVSSTEWLVESYRLQAGADLPGALAAAQMAVARSPRFGLGWARVAELEFSFGRVTAATEALKTTFLLAPLNAQAVALNGFLFAAKNEVQKGYEEFDRAIGLDGGLGNAWLGRGLCQIRRGEVELGLADLQVAATVEPQRAFLRSYLAKGWSMAGGWKQAMSELDLAKERDPNDPTAWLYSALILQQGNRINEAVSELERAQALNDHRGIYRSRLLLDQDRAVAGANLANIYRDAGMTEVSVREAGKAVSADYANYSAHLFLANSYRELNELRGVNLRFETAAVSEYLMANLLAPVGAGTLSQGVSQQEYSRLFERDGFRLSSETEYLSRGAWSQSAAQSGVFGDTEYSIEGSFLSDPGQRRNQDIDLWSATARVKQQLRPGDTVYFEATEAETRAGDLGSYHDEAEVNPQVRVRERLDPLLIAGYHHDWGEGNHSLVLATRAVDRLSAGNPSDQVGVVEGGALDALTFVSPVGMAQEYESEFTLNAVELQQVRETEWYETVAGFRYQSGEFDTVNSQAESGLNPNFSVPPGFAIEQRELSDFRRTSLYLYHSQRLLQTVRVVGGVSYDRLSFPVNHRFAPISGRERTVDDYLPKAGLIWNPMPNQTVRFAYTRSTGGAAFDQSLRLEPSQVAGINQAYRSIVPEALAGANVGAEFETFALTVDHRFATRTYVGLSGELLNSDIDQVTGVLWAQTFGPIVPAEFGRTIDYEEKSVQLTVNQLAGSNWAFGAGYRWSRSDLEARIPTAPFFSGLRFQEYSGELQQLRLGALFYHPTGFFLTTEALWTRQWSAQPTADLAPSDFWQYSAVGGWRMRNRRFELSIGVLNISDEDYRLAPINFTTDLPRERTFVLRCRVNL